MDSKDKKYIWKPRLAFLNALGPTTEEQSLHDELSSVTLIKENKEYLQEDISLPREGILLVRYSHNRIYGLHYYENKSHINSFCIDILFLSSWYLARLLSGNNNSISLKRKYTQQYTCNFDLFYYPFDTQVRIQKP